MDHQGNAIQNRNEVSPHTCQNDCLQRDNKQQLGKDAEKRFTPWSIVSGGVNWCGHWKTVQR